MIRDDDPDIPIRDSVISCHTQLVTLPLPLVELCERFINIAIKEFEGRMIKEQEAPTERSMRCPSCPTFT